MAEAQPQAKIGLVPCAVGGTSIRSWAPGKEVASLKVFPYDDTIRRMKVAMKDGTLKGILWHQGEGDRSGKGSKYYGTKMTQLVARLRQDLDAPNVPLVAGELGQLNETNANITAVMNGILRGLAPTITNYACVSAEGLTDKGDRLHFDTASARTLGTRYAAAMLELQAQGARSHRE